MYLSRGGALALLVVSVAALVGARLTLGDPDPASVIEDVDVRLAAPCQLSDGGRVVDAQVAVTSRTTEATHVALRLAVSEDDAVEAVWEDVLLPPGRDEQIVMLRGSLEAAKPAGTCTVGVDY